MNFCRGGIGCCEEEISFSFNTIIARDIEICYYKSTNRSQMKRLSKADDDDKIERAIKLFYCYAREDKALRDELDIHLSSLKRQNLVTSWYDGEIGPGTEWEKEIDKQLRSAHIILLLITPHFMASDYCYSTEMKRALERHQDGTARVIPVILRRTFWDGAPFSHLQVLPTDAKPVTQWTEMRHSGISLWAFTKLSSTYVSS